MLPFELQKRYNFNTRAPSILGTNYKNALVKAIVDYTIASKYISPETEAINVYPSLPGGTNPDPKKWTYVIVELESLITRCFALEWIDTSSIAVVNSIDLNVVVHNTSTGDAERIRQSLLLMGFTNFSIT